MGTVDKTQTVGQPWAGSSRHYVLQNTVSIVGLATGTVVQALSIPADTLVENVIIEVITAETCGATTATVGDGAGANSFDASTNLAATAGTKTLGAGGTDAYVTAGGKFYSAADTIDLTLTIASGPAAAGEFRITAICVDCSVQ